MRPIQSFCIALVALALAATGSVARAAESDSDKQAGEIIAKAYNFLATKGQAADGSFSAAGGPAVTAIVAHGLVRSGRSVSDPVVVKALGYVQKSVHPDGGIYGEGSRHKNYETCACLSAFAAANADGRYTPLIEKANAFLRGMQWDEKNKVARSRRSVWRRRLRRRDPARFVQHVVFDRRLEIGRGQGGRPGAAERPGVRVALPEPGDRAQRPPPSPRRIPTAAFITRPPAAAATRPARPPTTACAATAR